MIKKDNTQDVPKAPILTDEEVIRWMGDNNKIGSQWFHRCEAQRDADHDYYSPIIDSLRAEIAELKSSKPDREAVAKKLYYIDHPAKHYEGYWERSEMKELYYERADSILALQRNQ